MRWRSGDRVLSAYSPGVSSGRGHRINTRSNLRCRTGLRREGGRGNRPVDSPATIQMGRQAARSIVRAVRGEPSETFRYVDRGTVVTLGRRLGDHLDQRTQTSRLSRLARLAVHPYPISDRVPESGGGALRMDAFIPDLRTECPADPSLAQVSNRAGGSHGERHQNADRRNDARGQERLGQCGGGEFTLRSAERILISGIAERREHDGLA